MLAERVEERAHEWRILVQRTLETHSSLIAFGMRDERPVVLKVVRQPGDEWCSGQVLEAFDGRGVVRVIEYIEGAVLLERLSPGTPLAGLALSGGDEEATGILAELIPRMPPSLKSSMLFATVQDWGRGFNRYLASGDRQIPPDLVTQGQRLYSDLCASQKEVRLLHGDLQHYNVLFDSTRGWVAIDPKGVLGEVEYEIGASLRNPCERPHLFTTPKTIERRIRQYEDILKLDANRMFSWGFSQAVLSAIWSVEDGFIVDAGHSSILLAQALRLILG